MQIEIRGPEKCIAIYKCRIHDLNVVQDRLSDINIFYLIFRY